MFYCNYECYGKKGKFVYGISFIVAWAVNYSCSRVMVLLTWFDKCHNNFCLIVFRGDEFDG